MGRCERCDAEAPATELFTCSFCERRHCADHRLPENHNCIAQRASGAAAGGIEATIGVQETEQVQVQAPAPEPEPAAEDDDPEPAASVEQPETTPCAECGGPSRASRTYCGSCQAEIRASADGASRGDATGGWRQYDPDKPSEREGGASLSVPTPGRRSFLLALGAGAGAGGYAFHEQIRSAAGGLLGGFDGGGSDSIDEARAEALILERVNELRADRGLAAMSAGGRVGRIAKQRASDMADRGYYSHTTPEGETQAERYAFCGGAENLARSMVFERFERFDGEVVRHTSAAELADGIVGQWMASDPHRERGLFGQWTSAGVGVSITDGGEVYAVMSFCSTE